MGVDINKELELSAFRGNCMNRGQSFQVVTFDSDLHVNIIGRNGRGKSVELCVTAQDADRIRDLLIEARPLPTAKAPATKRAPKGEQQYRGNGKHEWEDVTIHPDSGELTRRLRVPGGWLYTQGDSSPIFVPVPDAVGYAV